MSGWINANGEEEKSTSNLRSPDSPAPQSTESLGGSGRSDGGFRGRSTSAGFTAGANDDESKGIMATVRSQAGSPIMARSPNGKDLIKYQGATITLDVAAHLGLVTRNPDGSFTDKNTSTALRDPAAEARAKAPAAAPAEPEGKTDGEPEGVSFGEAAEAAMQELIGGQQPGNLYKTIDSILHTGDVDMTTIERMASAAGVEPGDMIEKVATIHQGAYDAASDLMANAGIENGDAFQAFITSDPKRKADMLEAARNFIVHGKDEGLRTMAEDYIPHMDRYESARVKDMLTDAGYQCADKPGGGLFVMVNGQPVSWEVAVKQKIITFSRG